MVRNRDRIDGSLFPRKEGVLARTNAASRRAVATRKISLPDQHSRLMIRRWRILHCLWRRSWRSIQPMKAIAGTPRVNNKSMTPYC